MRPIHHNVTAAGDADELPGPAVLEARAGLLERRRSPSGGKNVHAIRPCRRTTLFWDYYSGILYDSTTTGIDLRCPLLGDEHGPM